MRSIALGDHDAVASGAFGFEERFIGGGQECFLEVRASNHSAYRLYERYGFNEIGRRRNYYPAAGGGSEDALVMACTLLD